MGCDCNLRPSGRPRKRRRRIRGRAQRPSKRDGQSHRGVSHREDGQNREMSVTTHAGSSCWDSGRTSHRKCRKSDGTDKCWGRSRRHWKGQRPREAWPSIDSGSVKENDGGGWQLFFRILEKEKFSCPSCRARSSRSLPLSLQEPACHVELPGFQSKVQWSLFVSNSAVVINDGDDVPPAWKCESCRQTTLIDGVVPRSARRGFGEPHFSVKLRRRQARPHAAVLRSRGL